MKRCSCLVFDWCSALWQENLGLQEGTHELCYNTACALIGQGQLSQAMRILQKAEGWTLVKIICKHNMHVTLQSISKTYIGFLGCF